MPTSAAPPLTSAIAVPESRFHALAGKLPKFVVGGEWVKWFGDQAAQLDEKTARKGQVTLSGQTASLATTPIPLESIPPGVWRVSYVVRVTTPGTISSSIQVTITWTEGGITQTETGAALIGNVTTTREGASRIIRVDHATPISYATTYASAGATPMTYRLDVLAETVGLDS